MKTLPNRFPSKAPLSAKFYGIDFTQELGTDTISTATWESVPEDDLTFTEQTITNASRQTNTKIGGGTEKIEYCVICRIVTVTRAETIEARVPLKILKDGAV